MSNDLSNRLTIRTFHSPLLSNHPAGMRHAVGHARATPIYQLMRFPKITLLTSKPKLIEV